MKTQLVWLPSLITALSVGQAPDSRLMDFVLADVDGTPITQSEVVAEARFVLARTRGPEAAINAPLAPDYLASILQALIHRTLILTELRRLQLARVPEDEVDQELVDVTRRAFGGEARTRHDFLLAAGLGDAVEGDHLLRNILRQELALQRFIDIRIRTALVIEETDLRRCYAEVKDVFGGLSFEQVRPRLKHRLSEQRELASLRRVVRQLRAKSKVRILGSLRPADLTESDDAPFSCPVDGS